MTALLDIGALDGVSIRRWSGMEMAITENPIRWQHPDVPFLQMTDLHMLLGDGRSLRLNAHLDDGSGYHGLYLWPDATSVLDLAGSAVSIYRFRELCELPLGCARLTQIVRDGPEAVIEVQLQIAEHSVRLLCGETCEQADGRVDIVCPDESILIQLDWQRPLQQSGNSKRG